MRLINKNYLQKALETLKKSKFLTFIDYLRATNEQINVYKKQIICVNKISAVTL